MTDDIFTVVCTYDTCDVGTVSNGYPVVPVPVKNTPDLRMLTARSWADPLLKSMCLRPRHGPQGAVSQSGQWVPFNTGHEWLNMTQNTVVTDRAVTVQNVHPGG